MKILFLSWWFPYPPDNGSRIRIFNLIKYLSRQHEITLLSFIQDERDREYVSILEDYCQEVHILPGREFQPWSLKGIMGFLSPRPRYFVDTYSPAMQRLVQRAFAYKQFDTVIVSQIAMVPYAVGLNGTPKILEELELSLSRDQFHSSRGLTGRVRWGFSWWKTIHFTARLLRGEFQACTVASKQEQANVFSIVPEYQPVVIIPNGVDLDFYNGNFGVPEPETLVFSGVLTYSANFDAMSFFLKDIYLLIKAVRPGVTLRITGRTEGVPIHTLPQRDGVVFTGYLDDIRPCVAQSQVSVVPLRVGGGTRLKILEAMALGTPVVSTSKGAEGLDVTPGEDILIADEPAEFADAVLHLLDDERLRARLAANGRRLVSEKYDWEHIGQKLDHLLQEIVENHSWR